MTETLRTRAVVALTGPALHYAEVTADEPARLRRLGTCDFEADVEAAVFTDGDPAALEALASALREVFADEAERSLVVVAHPTVTTSFFTPLPVGMDPAAVVDHLRQEAALLADVPPTQPVRVRPTPLHTEGEGAQARRWYHVVHVGEAVHGRLARLAQALGAADYDLVDGARAATGALGVEAAHGLRLAVGVYPGHTEVAVVSDGALRFGHAGAGGTSADTAYFALASLQWAGADAADLAEVGVYGTALATDRLADLAAFTGHQPRPLDVLDAFGRRPEGASAEALAAFAPVLGVGLRTA